MAYQIPVGAWSGDTVLILGGGPSIRDFDFGRLRGHGRVIAVNSAFVRYPDADVLFWADRRWFEWNVRSLGRHTGALKITRKEPHLPHPFDIKVVGHSAHALSRDAGEVAGFCSGGSSINIAALMGAKRIVLLGFDMTGGNWHEMHQKPPNQGRYRAKFMPAIEKMAPELERDGIEVVNTNPDSALRCFAFADIDDILGD